MKRALLIAGVLAAALVGFLVWLHGHDADTRAAALAGHARDSLVVTVTNYDTLTRWRLRTDTLRHDSIVTLHDTAIVWMARADSLPLAQALDTLRAACRALDSALGLCEASRLFWMAHADTLTAQRTEALGQLNAALARRTPRRCGLAVYGGYGIGTGGLGPQAGLGVSCRW
jgi:hypothetical protein